MTSGRHEPRQPRDPLWKRISKRYAAVRSRLRPRVPLVLLRHRRAIQHAAGHTPARPHVSRYQLAVHVHFSAHASPLPASRTGASSLAAQNPSLVRTVGRFFGNGAAAPRLAWGSLLHRVVVSRSARMASDSRRPEASAPRPSTWGAHITPPADARRALPPPQPRRSLQTFPRRATVNSEFRSRGSAGVFRHGAAAPAFAEALLHRHHPEVVRSSSSASPPVRHMRDASGPLGASRSSAWASHAIVVARRQPHAVNVSRGVLRSNTVPRTSHRIAAPQTLRASPPSLPGPRSNLYPLPAPRSFAAPAAASMAEQPRVSEPRPAPAAADRAQTAQPQLDIARLSEDVYRHIQRKIRIDRERRGL